MKQPKPMHHETVLEQKQLGGSQSIRINTITTSGDGIGFAININDAIETSNKLISLGDPPPPGYLGISFDEITPALAFLFDLPVNHLWITYIQPGSPADIAGIERDDILLKLNAI